MVTISFYYLRGRYTTSVFLNQRNIQVRVLCNDEAMLRITVWLPTCGHIH